MRRSLLAVVLAVVLGGSASGSAAAGAPAGSLPGAPGCPVLPADNVWRVDVSGLPVHPQSAQYVAAMGSAVGVHADFGSGLWDGGPIGIPFVTVPGDQARVDVRFTYADESDAGPYPIPPNPPIEGGPASHGDRHVLVVDRDACTLYELYAAYPRTDGSWRAGSGAIFPLGSNALRPATYTSADAAGLPILPGLVRYDEVEAGVIDHALRVTASSTQNMFLWPARHQAGSADPNLPPMGLRLRLKASFDISGFPLADQVILTALKKYGMFVADNGSSWFVSGVPDERWDNDVLQALGGVHGSDFEAIDESSLIVDPDSGQVAVGAPALSIADRSAVEGDSGTMNVGLTIRLAEPAVQPFTLTVVTADGTAVAGSDYRSTTRSITFAAGQRTAKCKVAVIGDLAVEPDETFFVRTSGAEATVTVVNDD